MFDTLSPYVNPVMPEQQDEMQLAVFMTGFDSVTSGNDEYIILTSPDTVPGDYHRFYQLPNDSRTVAELMGVMESAGKLNSIPYVNRSIG